MTVLPTARFPAADPCFGGWKATTNMFELYGGHSDAALLCSAIGARLCTATQLADGETEEKNGNMDCESKGQNVWTSEECEVDVCGDGATTTGGTAPEGSPCSFP